MTAAGRIAVLETNGSGGGRRSGHTSDMRFVAILVTSAAVSLIATTGAIAAHRVEATPSVEGSPIASATEGAGPTVGMVGNSISWQSETEIRHFVGLSHDLAYFQAVIGGTIAGQRPSIVEAVTSPGGPDILLVELGTNDAVRNHSLSQFTSDIRATLNAVTPYVDAVVWFDMKSSGSGSYPDFNRNAPSFNARLRQVVAEYPKAVVGHYSAWAEAIGDSAFAADLVHLSPLGEREFGLMAMQAADGFDPALTTGPYWDVRDSSWVAEAISRCTIEGLVSGYPNGTFRALAGTVHFTVSRAQWLAMLWRHAGAPTGYPPAPWSDVPSWIDDAARWAATEGVAVGYRDGTLRPERVPTRAEATSMMYGLAGSPPVEGLPPHGLIGVPPWLEASVRLAVSTGVVAGYPDGTFRPDLVVTRGQAVNFVDRFASASAPPIESPPPSVPPPSSTTAGGPLPPAPSPDPSTTTSTSTTVLVAPGPD